MKKVLLPLDGSDCATHTLAWALDLLNKNQVALHLLHVGGNHTDTEFGLPREAESHAILAHATYRVEQAGFVLGSVSSVEGEKTAQTICDYAEQEHMDQIVIGTHGRGLSRFLMGSVSQDILKYATKPVLLIKHAAESDEHSQHARVAGIGAKETEEYNLLVPVSDSTASPYTLDWIIHNMNPRRTRFHLLHIVPLIGAAGVAPLHLQEGEILVDRASAKLREAGYTVAETRVGIGDPVEEICLYADEHHMDQIFIGTSHKAGLFSNIFTDTGHKVFNQAKQSTVVFYHNHANQQDEHSAGQQFASGTSSGDAIW